MPVALRRLLPSLAFLLACRGGAPDFPETPLGRVGHDWLAAHNRAEGHAAVHGQFTPAVQPSLVKVDVQVNRADIDPRAELIAQPNPQPR